MIVSHAIPADHLRREFEETSSLFAAQPPVIQRFIETQARLIAEGLMSHNGKAIFSLPDRVVINVRFVGQPAAVTIPETLRTQAAGGGRGLFSRVGSQESITYLLRSLEQSPDEAVSTSAKLLRFAAASHLVHNMLPDGRQVTYLPLEDEAIPSIPFGDGSVESAITQATDAIAEQGPSDNLRGELQSPFVPAARRFFLPQWVPFDDEGNLLVGSETEASAHVQSMQNYVQILHRSSSLAPFVVAWDEYQRKRYGILGQLINQGRALANYRTLDIIREIHDRAKQGSLNRGLSVTIPYFDDQKLEMATIQLEIIPAGRIMFVPAFVGRSSRNKQAQVNQDTRLNTSTRKHLLGQLKALEVAFLGEAILA